MQKEVFLHEINNEGLMVMMFNQHGLYHVRICELTNDGDSVQIVNVETADYDSALNLYNLLIDNYKYNN